LLLPILVWAYVVILRKRHRNAVRYSSLLLLKNVENGSKIRRHIPPALFLLCLLAAVLSLAKPEFNYLPPHQVTIILALDVSDSMQSKDIRPNRLDASKKAAAAFVDQQPPDVRIGVVSFSTTAALVQSPTSNHNSVKAAIDRLEVQARTAIGDGILTSVNAILAGQGEESALVPVAAFPNRGTSSNQTPELLPTSNNATATAIIVLLSDGRNNEGPTPDAILGVAITHGVLIYTVGMGSPDDVAMGIGSGPTQTKLDQGTLQQIAQSTGGEYYAAENATSLFNIYQKLSQQLVMPKEHLDITLGFNIASAVLLLAAGALSLLWFI
jgi:Ca-activated chloride channel family protein